MPSRTNEGNNPGSERSDVATSQVLGEALVLLGPVGEYWVKGGYAKTSAGKGIPTLDRGAVCFSATGAIFRSIGRDAVGKAFRTAIDCLSYQVSEPIGIWNDDPATTFAQVREVFNRAIAEELFREETEGRLAA